METSVTDTSREPLAPKRVRPPRSFFVGRGTVIAFLKFITIGGTGLCLTLAVTYTLTDIVHIWYFWSFLVATFLAWTFVFFMNALFTFANEGHSHLTFKRYLGFMFSYLLVFWISAGITYILTSILFVPYLVSIIIGTVATTLLTFTLSKFLIFSHGKSMRS
jgi:putative flippase GtrA